MASGTPSTYVLIDDRGNFYCCTESRAVAEGVAKRKRLIIKRVTHIDNLTEE